MLSIALGGCDFVEEQTATSTPPPSPTNTPPPATATTPPTERPATATPGEPGTPPATGLVLPVSIAAAPDDLPDYDRGTWYHWTDEDGDCQNARQEVLIAESSVAVTFRSDEDCRVATGMWVGPYTGTPVDDPGDLDVDHMVPLENAHRSGGWSWDPDRKREFANSLAYENHLIATTARANRSKGSKGPEEWRPPLEEYWCVYAIDWVTIKNQWGLTVTEAEYIALSDMLATCDATILLQPTQGTPPAPPTATVRPTATPPASLQTDLRYDPFGPDRDCGEFDTYAEALAFFLAAGGPEADPHRLDVNGDGEPCESLPGGPSAGMTQPPGGPAAMSRGREIARDGDSACVAAVPPGDPGVLSSPAAGSAGPNCEPEPPAAALPVLPPAATPPPTPPLSPAPAPTPHGLPGSATKGIDGLGSQTADANCADFPGWREAQDFFLAQGGPAEDPHGLDRNRDGVACQSLPGAPDGSATPTMSAPTPEPDPTPAAQAFADLPFDPSGPDRNCDEFTSWWDAQNFFLAAGGPVDDPHRLDRNGDGAACESLPGAPRGGTVEDAPDAPPSPPLTAPPPQAVFADRNCGDFVNWQDAQDFFLSEGGPGVDPHRLDRNSDGVACESLPGAPVVGVVEDAPDTPSSPPLSAPPPPALFADRNCGDFASWQDAQDFFLAEGGPAVDPHRLDRDGDGVACESLPGAP